MNLTLTNLNQPATPAKAAAPAANVATAPLKSDLAGAAAAAIPAGDAVQAAPAQRPALVFAQWLGLEQIAPQSIDTAAAVPGGAARETDTPADEQQLADLPLTGAMATPLMPMMQATLATLAAVVAAQPGVPNAQEPAPGGDTGFSLPAATASPSREGRVAPASLAVAAPALPMAEPPIQRAAAPDAAPPTVPAAASTSAAAAAPAATPRSAAPAALGAASNIVAPAALAAASNIAVPAELAAVSNIAAPAELAAASNIMAPAELAAASNIVAPAALAAASNIVAPAARAAASNTVAPVVPAAASKSAAAGTAATAAATTAMNIVAPAVPATASKSAAPAALPAGATRAAPTAAAARDVASNTDAPQDQAAPDSEHSVATLGVAVAPPANPQRTADTVTLSGPPTAWRQTLQEALGERLHLQVGKNAEQAVIRLEPPMLGRVEIAIRHSAGSLEVHITATHGEVLRQLQSVSEGLRNDLAQRQFSDVSVNIAPAPRAANGAPMFAGGEDRGRQQEAQQEARQQEQVPGQALAEANFGTSPFSLNGRS